MAGANGVPNLSILDGWWIEGYNGRMDGLLGLVILQAIGRRQMLTRLIVCSR